MPRSAILGVGHHVPDKVVTNDDLARLMPTSDAWIQQRTGIRERRFIAESGTGASDLAVPAARMAVERAGRKVEDVDMIIFATLSPDVNFPGSGCFLGHKLGLPGVPALDIRNQCSGFLYGLSIADAWVRAGAYRNILVVGAEVHSTGLDFSERGRDVAVLFGDGAGAALIGQSPGDERGLLSIALHADGAGAQDLWLQAPASSHIPRLTPEMMERGDHFPRMNGKQVFRWATEKMPEVSLEVLEKAGLGVSAVDLFVPHQANMRINQLVASKLGLPEDKVVHNIERYGNTTAATIPIGLSEAWAEGRLHEGATTLLAAFGSGYTWGAAVVRF
ncbi:3-oxoacyl-ACP synthase III family protein [Chondromyces crocatus]|uniref:Beta-ketoacyl-[acyl-carrier-protein] synthase III n=1 Tax=Chondromyces crocatus TaxID=52 RepID=A0A0K1ELT8_CHOCO|nr:beta-ketoacyl-ACP synthase III [Chondromyces crocatus]AKT41870.1 3-oxoacyl-ACP synthase [Chondromyces crocatus]